MQLTEFNQVYQNLLIRLTEQGEKTDSTILDQTVYLLEQLRRTEGHAFKRLKALSTKISMNLLPIEKLRPVLNAKIPDRVKLDALIIEYHALVIDKFDLTLPTSNIQQVGQMTGSTDGGRT